MLSNRLTVGLLLMFVAVATLGGMALAAAKPKVLLLPLVPAADINVTESEAVDTRLAKALKDFPGYEAATIADYEALAGKKPARRVLQCGADMNCLYQQLKRAPYDLVLVGEVDIAGGTKREVAFTVYNLNQRESRRDKTFHYTKGKFGAKRAASWIGKLLETPGELVDMDEDAAPAVTRAPAKPTPPVAAAPALPSGGEVKDGIKDALAAYLKGDLDGAIAGISDVVANPCRCDADRDAYTVKAMLEQFDKALRKAKASLGKALGDEAVTALKTLGGLDANLTREAEKYELPGESAWVGRINAWSADAYVRLAMQQMKEWAFVAAKASLEKALEIDPNNAVAKEELAKMSDDYANKLLRRANVAAFSEPETAIDYLKQVMQLVAPGEPLYKKAKAKLDELEQ